MVINKKVEIKSSLCLSTTPYGRGSIKIHTLFSWALDGASFFGRFFPGEGVRISRTWSGRGSEVN
jgi:hypothetical protein